MAVVKPDTFTGANIILDGTGHIGVSKSFEAPKIEFLTLEQNGGGIGREVVIGVLKAMTAKVVVEQMSRAAYTAASKQFTEEATIFVKKSITGEGGAKLYQATVKGNVKMLENPDGEAGKAAETSLEIAVSAYTLEVGGTKLIEIDAKNMICIIDGKDLLADMRSHIQ